MFQDILGEQGTQEKDEAGTDEGRRLLLKGLAGSLALLFGGRLLTAAGTAEAREAAVSPGVHVVKRGEYLIGIAEKHGVDWEAMMFGNERFLKQKYGEVCGSLSRRYRRRPRGKGHYCNERFFKPYGNTLQPGWKLKIPSKEAPQKIREIVGKIKGNKVAIVIDDSGSMLDDRERVGEFYMAALRHHKKKIAGVWLYADGEVRRYRQGGVEFRNGGSMENTHGALQEAAGEKPDSIILITDEIGDDWDFEKVHELPPIIAHCLQNVGRYECEETLKRVAKLTEGQYVRGIQ